MLATDLAVTDAEPEGHAVAIDDHAVRVTLTKA